MHFFGPNLEFDNGLIGGDDGGMKGLVAIGLGLSDIIFDAAIHWCIKGMNNAEDEIARSNVINDVAEGVKVVDLVDVLIEFGEFFMERIDGLLAVGSGEVDLLTLEGRANFVFGFFHDSFGGFVASPDEVLKIMETLGVDIRESEVSHLYAELAHIKTIGERSKNLKSFLSDFLLAVGRKGREGAHIMKTIGELDNQDADVGAESDEQADEIILGLGEIGVDVTHAFTGGAEFGDAIDEKSDALAEFVFDII